jgi:homoserine O-acetyltransferase/O-succinyltransferase
MPLNIYKYNKSFALESGESFKNIEIAYHTYGTLSDRRDNVIWVCHALTANSDVKEWWPHTVEKGKFLDPEHNFIICANILGSHYGTTGPLSINPDTGKPWYGDFPKITIRDIVHCHQLLAEHLAISSVKLLIGSSLGGFQCLEWAVIQPNFPERLVLLATASRSKPWAVALNESQRMAIKSDSTFGDKSDTAAKNGLAAARSIALLSYRGAEAYNTTQDATYDEKRQEELPACTYQRYQGEKLCKRFNVYSYYRLTQTIDSHDIGRGRGGEAKALSKIKSSTTIIAITSDILFPPKDHSIFCKHIPNAQYYEIESSFGHDGFLIEHEQLNTIIRNLNI